MKRTFEFAKRNIKEIVRDPLSLIFLVATPLVMLVLFYYLFHGQTSQFDIQSFAPGIVAFSNTFIALFVGILIAQDRSSSFLTRLYASPMKSRDFILGYILAMIPIAVVQSILFFGVACVLDTSFFSVRLLLGVVGSLLVSILFISCGILFGSICNEKSIGGVNTILIMGQSLLSGMWFPMEGMSQGFKNVVEALPFRGAVLLIQNLCSGEITDLWKDIFYPLVIVLVYTIIALVAAIMVYSKKMSRDNK